MFSITIYPISMLISIYIVGETSPRLNKKAEKQGGRQSVGAHDNGKITALTGIFWKHEAQPAGRQGA